MERITVETDDEIGDCLSHFTATELRALASNIGVSRKRGDSKRQTAMRIVEQAPGVAARIVENDAEVPIDANAFKEAREVDEKYISLDEAQRRAKNRKMFYKLKHLQNAIWHVAECYEALVDWEYGSGLTSITVKPKDDVEMNPLLREREHIIMTSHGRVVSPDSIVKAEKPSIKWRVLLSSIENFYCP